MSEPVASPRIVNGIAVRARENNSFWLEVALVLCMAVPFLDMIVGSIWLLHLLIGCFAGEDVQPGEKREPTAL